MPEPSDRPWRTRPRPAAPPSTAELDRRQALAGLTGASLAGAFALSGAARGAEPSQQAQPAAEQVDATTGPSIKEFHFETLGDLKAKVPAGRLGKIDLGRVILGGNLINGFAHARDLIYMSDLIKAYHTKWKTFGTFNLAEQCGINTILTNPMLAPMVVEYWDRGLGEIEFIAQCKGKTEKELLDCVAYSIDQGAGAAYVQGAAADQYVLDGNFDWIARALDLMRENSLPAGIGAHRIETIRSCVDRGFEPDFWMKTLHHHRYWSARPDNEHDNLWCEKPEETIAFMEQLPQPWIAFKVLAAGAIHPRDGFRYAFENGADFVCAGMYDFQLVEDANIACDVLKATQQRKRPWRA
jgi:hypothetical protein